MNLKDRILNKSNLWHLGAIVLFITISCIYFSPALKGYALKQSDIVSFIGMSREVDDYRKNDNEQVLWTNAMFSGMPTTQISMLYEGTWLSDTMTKIFRFGLPAPIYYLFVYLIGFYVLALSLRIRPLIGMIGSVAFGLSSYFIVILEAGHNSKAAAIGFAPLMLAGFIMAYRMKNWILGVALAGLFMTIELAANHIQITYYMAFVMLMFGIVELVRHIRKGEVVKFSKITGLLLVSYGLAAMVNYGNLFGTIHYAKQTIRGGSELTINPAGESNEADATTGLDRSYVTNWSYGQGETFTLIVPNFKGGETQMIASNEANDDLIKDMRKDLGQFGSQVVQQNQYWGNQPFTSGPVYVGVIVLLLAFLGLVYSKEKYKWALLSATLLAIALSWGKNYVTVLILLPILLYLVNIFLDKQKQLIFNGVNTLLFLIILALNVGPSLTDFFLDVVPGYNKLRAVTIILVIAELCIPILAILFLHRLFKKREEIKKEPLGFYIVSGVFLLFLLINVLAPTTFNTFISDQEEAMLASITDPAAVGQYNEFFGYLEDVRKAIFKKDVVRSLGFFILGAGLIFLFIRKEFSKYILGGSLLVLIFADLILVDQRYINNEGRGKNYNQWVERYEMRYPFLATEGEQSILAIELHDHPEVKVGIDSALQVLEQKFREDKDISSREKQARRDYMTFRMLNRSTNFRVYEMGNPFNSSYSSYFFKSIGGYHGAKLGKYQDLIDFHISKGNPSVMNMLNVKYFVQIGQGPDGKRASKLARINEKAMGNAWFTKSISIVANADEEIMAMDAYTATILKQKGESKVFINGELKTYAELKGDEVVSVQTPDMDTPLTIESIPYEQAKTRPLALISDTTGFNWVYNSAPDTMFNKIFSLETEGMAGWNPEQTTIMDQRFQDKVSSTTYSGLGSIEMTSYHPDKMVYQTNSSDKQFAVFSEIYYEDGWKAYIDGEESPIVRVNYALRGLEIPAGEHEIKFEFTSTTFEKSRTYALIGSGLLLVLLGLGIYMAVKRNDSSELIDAMASNESEKK